MGQLRSPGDPDDGPERI